MRSTVPTARIKVILVVLLFLISGCSSNGETVRTEVEEIPPSLDVINDGEKVSISLPSRYYSIGEVQNAENLRKHAEENRYESETIDYQGNIVIVMSEERYHELMDTYAKDIEDLEERLMEEDFTSIGHDDTFTVYQLVLKGPAKESDSDRLMTAVQSLAISATLYALFTGEKNPDIRIIISDHEGNQVSEEHFRETFAQLMSDLQASGQSYEETMPYDDYAD